MPLSTQQHDALTAVLAALRVQVGALVPDASAPAPPPPTEFVPTLTEQTLNLAKLVVFSAYHESSRYTRYQRLVVLSGATGKVAFRGIDGRSTAGGATREIGGRTLTLNFDGLPVASVSLAVGAIAGEFSMDLENVTHGWKKMTITGLDADESNPVFWAAVVKQLPFGPQPFIPVTRGSYELENSPNPASQFTALVPDRFAPTARPVAVKREYLAPPVQRVTTNISTGAGYWQIPRASLNCEYLVPIRWADIHRPNVNKDGIRSTFDAQAYEPSIMFAALPSVALLDGPRGVGTISYATSFKGATAVVNGVARENVYFSDPWRIGKILENGTVQTLVGYRHTDFGHWEDLNLVPPQHKLELVGDWSAVPEAARSFHEVWGFAWDERTLAVDANAPLIEGESPHVVGPTMFVADSQRNRICRIEFSPTDRTIPAKVTEFITGLQDPWDIVYVNGEIIVTERKAHRIVAYSADTGALLRIVLQGQALATVDVNRIALYNAGQNVTTCRAADCVAPEGLFHQDGWLYFGSLAQAQVRKVRIDGTGLAVVCTVNMTGGGPPKYVKLALSDGTFGPRGMVFSWNWSNQYGGGPQMNHPTGPLMQAWWNLQTGGTGDWFTRAGYAQAGCVFRGRLITASMVEGVCRISKTQAGDLVESAAVTRGRTEYVTRGLNLIHGGDGFGFYGLPLPWSVSSDIDAYLIFNGHTQ